MGDVIYSMSVSLDGYINGPDGTFRWSMPSEELHWFHNEQTHALGGHLLGRRLYETMLFWETAEQEPDADAVMLDFARAWKPLAKVVFSSTLESVEGNARLATGDVAEELAALRASTDKDIGVGGPTLAAACIEQGLVDEFHVFVHPIIVGGGTPFFPPLAESIPLELVETRTFEDRVIFERYRRQ
jgi:dihydrofolate reductase